MKQLNHAMKLLTSLVMLVSLLALSACEKEQQAAAPEESKAEKQVITWKLAQTWGTGFPIFGDAVIKMTDMVKEMSGGEFEIRIDSANKHKAAFGILDMVKAGQYEMGHSASYYWKGKDPNTMFFSTMPFGMIAPEQYAWFYYGGGMELMKKVYDEHGVYAFPGGNTGNQMGGWFRKEINTFDDLDGLKMRVPGFAGEILSKLGVVVTNIAPGELYTALDRGTIDALEWVGPALDLRMGFHKVAPYYYTGWHEPGTELMYFFNKDSMAKLPDWAISILKNAARLTAYNMTTHTFAENAENWSTISEQFPNVQVKEFPPEVMAALRDSNNALLASEMQRSEVAKKVLESRAAYLKKARAWTQIGTQAYLQSLVD